MGPQAAQDSIRKALAMGADEALLISDEAAEGSDLVATTNALAAAEGGRRLQSSSASSQATPTAPCSGPRSRTGSGCR